MVDYKIIHFKLISMKKIYFLLLLCLMTFKVSLAQSPVISVNPTSFDEEVNAGESVYVNVTIENSGNRDLKWSVSGEKVSFTKEDYADWTLPENQDHITDHVWLTQQHVWGLFNIKKQDEFDHEESPLGTLWAMGATSEVNPEDYMPWVAAIEYDPMSMIDETMSMLCMEEMRFFDIEFHSYNPHPMDGGGYSYTRHEVYRWIKPELYSGNIKPGTSYDLEIKLDAEDLVAGFYTGELVIESNDVNNPEVLLEFDLTVSGGAPSISVNPLVLDFGSKVIGGSYTKQLTIFNSGDGFLEISEINMESEVFSVEESQISVAPGKEYELEVTFSPADVEEYTTVVEFVNNVEGSSPYANSLIGEGVDVPGIAVDPSSIEVELESGQTTSRILNIENPGDGILEGTINLIPADQEEVTFIKEDYADWTNHNNIDIITPGVGITRQNSQGIFNIMMEDSYQFNLSPENTLWAFGYSGEVDPEEYSDWRSAVNTYPPLMVNRPMSMYIENQDKYIDIKFLSWTQGSDGGGFSYIRDATVNFIEIESDEGSVEPGLTANLDFLFDATYLNAGLYEGYIRINTNIPDNPQVNIPISLTVTGESEIFVNPELDFGTVFPGYVRTIELEIQNIGTDVLEITSVDLADGEHYTIDDYDEYIQPGDFGMITVTFAPQSTGSFPDIITIHNNDPNDPEYLIDLSGTSTEPPVVDVDTTPIVETINSGESISLNIDIGNTGNANLEGQLGAYISDSVFFEKESYADWTLPENQDHITNAVWITRANIRGLFNIKIEDEFDDNNYLSPLGTVWAAGSGLSTELDDYDTWRNASGGNPPNNVVGNTMSMICIEERRSFDLYFHSWISGGMDDGGGGFSYTRVEIPAWVKIFDRDFVAESDQSTSKEFLIDATNMAVGDYEAYLTVASNDPVNPQVDIPVSITVLGEPEIYADDILEFNEVPVDRSHSKTLTIYNTGADVLTISELSNTQDEFEIVESGEIDVDPFESVTIEIVFSPDAADVYEDVLTITSNDPENETINVALQGTGVLAPEIAVDPEYIDVLLPVGETENFEIVIDNLGGANLEWAIELSKTFTKEDYADWSLPENQDRITDNVWITRKNSQGIFNIAKEADFAPSSPEDTKWAMGLTEDLEPEDYTSWRNAHNWDPPGMVGENMSLYLVSDDVYFDIVFHSWTSGGNGGGFSYTRQLPLPDFITFSNTEGEITSGESEILEVIIDTEDQQGTYSGFFYIESNDPLNPIKIINMEINIGGVYVENPVADVFVNQGFGVHTIDVSEVFSNYDTGTLDFLPISSDIDVVTVEVDGNDLIITEVDGGTSLITLRAESIAGNVEYIDFVFTVNTPPVVVNPLEDITVAEGFESYEVDISGVFADEDGDELSYWAESSDEDVVTVSLSGTVLHVYESGTGTATISVTADDGMLDVTDSFSFTVNAAPVVVNPLEDITVAEGFESYEVDISGVFADEDGDELSYWAESSDEDVVTVSLSGMVLHVYESGTGTATISVTADDGMLDVTDSFTFTVSEITYIEEMTLFDVKLYPNPTKGNLTVTFGNMLNGDDIIIEVISSQGLKVYSDIFSVTTSELELNLSKLNIGLYFLKISNEKTTVIKQFIIF